MVQQEVLAFPAARCTGEHPTRAPQAPIKRVRATNGGTINPGEPTLGTARSRVECYGKSRLARWLAPFDAEAARARWITELNAVFRS